MIQAALGGLAAAQCGKALPYRRYELLISEAAPQTGGAASLVFKLPTVRQSLTALCGGKAAFVELG